MHLEAERGSWYVRGGPAPPGRCRGAARGRARGARAHGSRGRRGHHRGRAGLTGSSWPAASAWRPRWWSPTPTPPRSTATCCPARGRGRACRGRGTGYPRARRPHPRPGGCAGHGRGWRPRPPRCRASCCCWPCAGRTPGLAHHTVSFPADYDAEFDAVFGAGRHRGVPVPVDDPAVYVSAPDDPALRPHGDGEAWFVLVNAPRHAPARPAPPGSTGTPPGWPSATPTACWRSWPAAAPTCAAVVLWRVVRTPADLERETASVGRVDLRFVVQRGARGVPATVQPLAGAGAVPRRRIVAPRRRAAPGDAERADRRRDGRHGLRAASRRHGPLRAEPAAATTCTRAASARPAAAAAPTVAHAAEDAAGGSRSPGRTLPPPPPGWAAPRP